MPTAISYSAVLICWLVAADCAAQHPYQTNLESLNKLGVEISDIETVDNLTAGWAKVAVADMPAIMELLEETPSIMTLILGTVVEDADYSKIKSLKSVTEVRFTECTLHPQIVRHIAASPSIKELYFQQCTLSREVAEAMGVCKSLRVLTVSSSGGLAADDFAFLQNLKALEFLTLNNAFDIDGPRALKFDDRSLRGLRGLPALKGLSLHGTDVGTAVFQALDALPKLEVVDLSDTKVSLADAQRYNNGRPQLRLIYVVR